MIRYTLHVSCQCSVHTKIYVLLLFNDPNAISTENIDAICIMFSTSDCYIRPTNVWHHRKRVNIGKSYLLLLQIALFRYLASITRVSGNQKL